MADIRTETPKVAELTDRLVADIKRRKLAPGDRYLTTVEASQMLGVGNGLANRALQTLERRRIIVRQQRTGAFVADPPHNTKPALDRVHFLVHKKYLRAEGVGQDESLLGMERELPGVPVQISFLPAADEERFVNELIEDSLRAKRRDGFVLVRAAFETQRLFSTSDIPAVVHGTVYPSIERLATLTSDMRQVGGLLAEHLLERGHTAIAYFNRQVVFGGDQRTMEGIAAVLHAAGHGLDALTCRFLPTSRDVYLAEAEELFGQANHPTGIICRTASMADAVAEVAHGKGLAVGKELEITVCEYYLKPRERARYAWARPQISAEQQGRQLARLLISQITNDNGSLGHEVIPVALEIPENAKRPASRGASGNGAETQKRD